MTLTSCDDDDDDDCDQNNMLALLTGECKGNWRKIKQNKRKKITVSPDSDERNETMGHQEKTVQKQRRTEDTLEVLFVQ
jgi:hypothetical protein